MIESSFKTAIISGFSMIYYFTLDLSKTTSPRTQL